MQATPGCTGSTQAGAVAGPVQTPPALERTLVILKPDAIQRRLAGVILERFERKGLRIAACKLIRISRATAEDQYAAHKGKYFYEPLVNYMTSGPVLVLVLEGNGAIAVVRTLMGPTFGPEAPPGTLRGDFGLSQRFNLVHGSDSPEAAGREIAIYFKPEEIVDYAGCDHPWVYDTSGGQIV